MYVHVQQIVEIALSQFAAGMSERRLTLIDRNRDLWLYPVGGTSTSKGASSKTANSNRHKLHVQVCLFTYLHMHNVTCTLSASCTTYTALFNDCEQSNRAHLHITQHSTANRVLMR
jgi:hypothetical protein